MSMTIAKFLEQMDFEGFGKDVESMCAAGWFDWFCKDQGLQGRLNKMVPAVRRISQSEMIDADRMSVIFKNNCPMWVDSTYDDFRILDENGDVAYCVIPRYPVKYRGLEFGKRPRHGQPKPIEWTSVVWDWVADEDDLLPLHIDNLAKGKRVSDERQVVYGPRYEMYAYFGV